MKTKVLLNAQDFLDMGGKIIPGMKLFTNPELSVSNHLSKKYLSRESKEFVVDEYIPNKGVKVNGTMKPLGARWLYLLHDVKL